MKPIMLKKQVRLGPGRCLTLSVSGMKYRLFRSLVTIAVLALATTFLSHILAHSILDNDTRVLASTELKGKRALGEWIGRLNSPDSATTIRIKLAEGDKIRVKEYETWSGLSRKELDEARQSARRATGIERYLRDLPADKQVVLLGDQVPAEVMMSLSKPAQLEVFLGHWKDLGLPAPLDNLEQFKQAAREDLPRLEKVTARIVQGQQTAIAKGKTARGDDTILEWIARNNRSAVQALAGAGFQIEPNDVAGLAQRAEDELKRQELAGWIQQDDIRGLLVAHLELDPQKPFNLATVQNWLNNSDRADWLAQTLREKAGTREFSGPRLLSLARTFQRETMLQAALGDEIPRPREGLFDLPRRLQMLILLSFLVCAVGVCNAMFMSVTERFTEIATMKCIGALDGFLMLMFLFESAIQGLIGSVAGIILGTVLALLRAWIELGGLVFEGIPWADLLACGGLTLLAGMFLAVIAAVGPAWMAARLVPMEAMRID